MLMACTPVAVHAVGMHRFILLFLALSSANCGGAVSAPAGTTTDAGPTADTGGPSIDVGTPETWTETASCAEVKATCGSDPAMVVLGHSAGLAGLDGARVEFAVRYLDEEGGGLDVPHRVALGRTVVHGDAFSTCVCVPHGANMYPEVAAVVYLPGTTTSTSKDVARASYSQRYATLGDEDVSYALGAVPTALQKEAAVAAMVERTAKITMTNLALVEGRRMIAGLIADDRPFAPQTSSGAVEGGKVDLHWMMPGRASASERVAFFVDQNENGLCDVDGSDRGALLPSSTAIAFSGAWLTGSALAPVCDALQPGAPRE
jgi:hypothetical protein